MKRLAGAVPKTFNLLSIGQRGVGKTVFLAGSYTELHPEDEWEDGPSLWFDCRDRQSQENIDRILAYVTQTGQYPPPTMKITHFNFSLKRHNWRGEQTLCQFHWWDVPGETCNLESLDFQSLVYQSHGCCVFIDGSRLAQEPDYGQELLSLFNQVVAIAALVQSNGLKYILALILTQCDRLPPEAAANPQITAGLLPLTSRLDQIGMVYRTFRSAAPIVVEAGKPVLRATETASALLWLGSELKQCHDPGLGSWLQNQILRSPRCRTQSWQTLGEGALASLVKVADQVRPGPTLLGIYLPLALRRPLEQLIWPTAGLAALALFLSLSYRLSFLPSFSLSASSQTIQNLKQLVQTEPERLEWHLQLASLYQQAGELDQAEATYDQILALEQTNLDALVGKAIVRNLQGDALTAARLFTQAESIAPTDLKPKIRGVAQAALQTPVPDRAGKSIQN